MEEDLKVEKQLPIETMKKAYRGITYIAHPLRMRILEFLDANGSSSVSQITKALDEDQIIVSQSLKKLRDANLVKTQRKGIFIYYSIDEEYPASLFKCIRKLYGYMTNNLKFLIDDHKEILPTDFTILAASRIKLFANFDKMRILEYLIINEECCVSKIAEGVGLDQLKVSQYLKKLLEDGFVKSRRDGRFVYYKITKGVHRTALKCIHKRYITLKDKSLF